jgi:hypothetical protein
MLQMLLLFLDAYMVAIGYAFAQITVYYLIIKQVIKLLCK